ncbi:hypothetical protein ACS0TY_007770 [Phlomoides rotata]
MWSLSSGLLIHFRSCYNLVFPFYSTRQVLVSLNNNCYKLENNVQVTRHSNGIRDINTLQPSAVARWDM